VDRRLLRTIGPTALYPNLFYGVAQGALIPVVPLLVHERHGNLAAAALASAMLPVGQLLANPPSGWLVQRIDEKRSMYVAATGSVVGTLVVYAAESVAALCVGVFLVGLAGAVFGIARHAFITKAVPLSHRGRALSWLAGSSRLGMLVGPLAGAAVIYASGEVRPALGVVLVSSLAILVVLRFAGGDFGAGAVPGADDGVPLRSPGVVTTLRESWPVLIRVGATGGLLNTMRISRQIFVPLVGLQLGLSPTAISLVVGVCATVDFAHFYLGGVIMDRFGRLWTALPAMLAFAVCHVVLAGCSVLPGSTGWFVGAALVMSVGNGLTAGIVAAMGSDLADQRSPAAFLGLWRVVTDSGPAVAPFAISVVTQVWSLSMAALGMSGVALVGAGMLVRYVPRYLPRRPGGFASSTTGDRHASTS